MHHDNNRMLSRSRRLIEIRRGGFLSHQTKDNGSQLGSNKAIGIKACVIRTSNALCSTMGSIEDINTTYLTGTCEVKGNDRPVVRDLHIGNKATFREVLDLFSFFCVAAS